MRTLGNAQNANFTGDTVSPGGIPKQTGLSAIYWIFQAWRMYVAQKAHSNKRARDSVHHMLLTADSQLSGHMVACSRSVATFLDSSFLHLTLEIVTLQRALLYCCELVEAKPVEELRNLKASSQPGQGACFGGHPR